MSFNRLKINNIIGIYILYKNNKTSIISIKKIKQVLSL